VKQFYNAWLTFSSQKSFSWCDKYRLSEAPDRRVRRAMEKENKKFRDAARKEFNDTVLVWHANKKHTTFPFIGLFVNMTIRDGLY